MGEEFGWAIRGRVEYTAWELGKKLCESNTENGAGDLGRKNDAAVTSPKV